MKRNAPESQKTKNNRSTHFRIQVRFRVEGLLGYPSADIERMFPEGLSTYSEIIS